MFGGDDEDGDFPSSSGGSKLASLFGLDQDSLQGNQSFQYTAPKQPPRSSHTAPANQKVAPPPAGAPAVLFATAVQAFRYVNGQYVKQGKLGAAVLGTHTTKDYKLLLYLSQQKQVTAAKIHAGFILTVQPNNYCSFYDDQRQNWSLMFESDKNAADFCKQVCVAKANSVPALESVLVQDVSVGEGPAVESGDSLEVVYTGWLLQNNAVGQMFDSNQNKDKLLRLKLGAGKVIKGWEDGMTGMKKCGRRLIVVPPRLAYGSEGVPDRVPPNSTLLFDAELRRVKVSKDNGSDRISAGSRDSAAPSPSSGVDNPPPDVPGCVQTSACGAGRSGDPRPKSNSLNEPSSNPDATKAKLISRMARMGQPMLPFLGGTAAHQESSDSELEDTSSSNSAKPRQTLQSPVTLSSAAPPSTHVQPRPVVTSGNSQMTITGFQPYSFAQSSGSQLQPVGHLYPPQAAPYLGSGDVTSFLMTEARQHNTEIRLAVGKVADKVDQMISKVDELHRRGDTSINVSNMSMETSMIMHNIQRIIQENECLKKEVLDKSSRIEEQNRKIGDLINQNQRYMEESHTWLEQRSDSLKSSSEQNQARLLRAEQDKVRLTEELASSAARVSQLQLEACEQQQKEAELQSKLSAALGDAQSHRQSTAALHAQLEEVKQVAERAQAQYRSEKQRRKETELRMSNTEEELQDMKTDKESLERTLSERKIKWRAERQRRDEEMEELRRSSQQELDSVRAQLRKARTNKDQAASEQLSQLQAELEDEWKSKCKQTLDHAEQQHRRALTELTEQRDALQERLRQLQEKVTTLKQSRDSEELQVLQHKYSALQQQQDNSGDTVAAEVKRVMNGVFQSLRAEFDVSESYSGQTVLSVLVSTIKSVTLQLLNGSHQTPPTKEEQQQEEDGEGGPPLQVKEERAGEEQQRQREDEEEEEEEEGEAVMEEQEKLSEELHSVSSAETDGEQEEEQKEEKEQVEEQQKKEEQEEEQQKKEEQEEETEQKQEEVDEEEEEEDCGSEEVRDGEDKESEETHGPPPNPPPPPTETHADGEPFFLSRPENNSPVAEDEDEMSLKGRPPPAPLFGDDDDDDEGLGWLG